MPYLSTEILMTNRCVRLLLDFDACAQRDSGQDSVFLHRRDRKFALTCEEQGEKPTSKRWMAYINRFNDAEAESRQALQTLRSWRRINSGFVAFGALFGILSMLGLLFYDGGQRINITVIIAFVAFQLLLALFTTVQSLAGWQPWRLVLRRFQKNAPNDIKTKLQPVLMAKAAQLGGLCFAFAGLLTLLTMVLLQDLAFGWSTTLETDAQAYHRFIGIIAAPWAWLWSLAAPDLALVEATRFFRASSPDTNINPALWGQWWPFIAMLWIMWTLLPRAILYFTAGLIVERKARRLLATHPAAAALQYRMQTPTLETGNEHNDSVDLPDISQQFALSPLPNARVLLTWAGAHDTALPQTLNADKMVVAKVGGSMTLVDDRNTVAKVASALSKKSSSISDTKPKTKAQKPYEYKVKTPKSEDKKAQASGQEAQESAPHKVSATTSTILKTSLKADDHNVLLVTHSWEPPTGELEDFIANAYKNWPKTAHIVIVPVATNMQREPQPHHVQQWLRFANRTLPDFVSVSLLPTDEVSSTLQDTQHE